MAEITRLEAQMESKAKSDFISSISHELRSPLQGILCGIDLLTEQKSADLPILSQIEMCSTTLLEVINHLLDFAKVNNLSGRVQSPIDQFRKKQSLDHMDNLPESNFERLLETYSYAKITEEVCDSMFYSHCYNKARVTNVDLILDISMDANVHSSADVGAWKRICINIINNALKYTDEGYVAASLKGGSRKDGRPVAVFTVVGKTLLGITSGETLLTLPTTFRYRAWHEQRVHEQPVGMVYVNMLVNRTDVLQTFPSVPTRG